MQKINQLDFAMIKDNSDKMLELQRFISFGSIEQMRSTAHNLREHAQYIGQNENGNPEFDRSIQLPSIKGVVGSEKIHGTNAGVCYSHLTGFYVQSRKNIIGILENQKDNAGCAFTANANKSEYFDIIQSLAMEYNIDLNENIITIYFEWSGGNIQKNSALSSLDKQAIIFRYFKVSKIIKPIVPDGQEEPSYWLETCVTDVDVDLVIDGNFGRNVASTIVDCTAGDIEVIREGIGELIF